MRKFLLNVVMLTSSFLPFGIQAQTFNNILVDNFSTDGECTIVINPRNPNYLIAAANPAALYRSSNAGLTWTPFNLSTFSSVGLIGDVALAANDSGQFFCQDMDNNFLFRTFRSDDYGITWTTETVFGDIGWTEDKNWLTVDRTPGSPYRGNLYCAWTRRSNAQTDGGHIFVNHSIDYGQSWVPRDTLAVDTAWPPIPPIGTGLAVGPLGEIGISWGGGTPNNIVYQKSVDGGNTWPTTSVIVDANVQPANDYYQYIPHAISFSAQFTSLACDISGGPNNGNLYCVWDDVRNGLTNADIFLARSTDGGITWATQRINNDTTTRNQVVPTVVVDPSSGFVYVSYLDARTNKDGFDDTLNYYLAWSIDGGMTFQTAKVSNQYSTLNNIHSDYMGLDAFAGKVHLLWVGGQASQQLWTCMIDQSVLTAFPSEQMDTPKLMLYPAIPNPSIDFTTFDFELPYSSIINMTITDLNGRVITQPMIGQKYEAGRHQYKLQHGELGMSAGIYFVTISTATESTSKKFIIAN